MDGFFIRQSVGLHTHVDAARLERPDDLRQVGAQKGFPPGEQHHARAGFCQVVGNAFDLVQTAFGEFSVGRADVALPAGQVAAGGDVELHVRRRGVEQGGEREVAEGPEREYAGHTLDYTRAAMDGWERRGDFAA